MHINRVITFIVYGIVNYEIYMNVLHNWIKAHLYKHDSVVQGVPWAGDSQLVSLSQFF
jgi:hypothetical protein